MVNNKQRVITPKQHHIKSFFRFAFKVTPTAILIGAPTDRVPKKPKPIMPYLFQMRCTIGCFGFSSFTTLFFLKIALILSPKNADTNTPANPPVTVEENMVKGDRPNANPAGMAAYISKAASPATVNVSKSMVIL